MELLDGIGQFVMALPVYVINGLLLLVYGIMGSFPALLSIAAAAGFALGPDAIVQRMVGMRPLRDERGSVSVSPRTAQGMTVLVLLFWLGAQWGMGAPVPWLGAAMWLVGLVAVLAVPAQRFNLSWMVKTGLMIYALAVIGSRLYLNYTTHLTPEQWASMLGSTKTAAQVLASTRANVNTIALWGLWLVVPLGYFSMLVQQVFMHPMSITNPFQSAEQMLMQLRDRGGR